MPQLKGVFGWELVRESEGLKCQVTRVQETLTSLGTSGNTVEEITENWTTDWENSSRKQQQDVK